MTRSIREHFLSSKEEVTVNMLNGCAHTGNKCVYTQAHPGNNMMEGSSRPSGIFMEAGNTGCWMLCSDAKTMLQSRIMIRGSGNLEEGGGGRGQKHFAYFLSTWKRSYWKGTPTGSKGRRQ